ncbi:hypothetical protein ACLMJK_000881 [Lecanora helva]
MAGLELLIIGVTTAFIGSSTSSQHAKHRRQNSTNYVPPAGKLFLAQQRSCGTLFNGNGIANANFVASQASTSRSFDDDVENLLDQGW